jgi:type II secretory pathway pseudopilin PulG
MTNGRGMCVQPSRRHRSEAGYTMIMFVMALAIMSIMMGAAVQAVSFQMQREREAELIFRGEQYVEAVRLYKKRFGRNPMQLKEMWEAKPRVLRKKWKDPMTDSEVWGLVFVGQEGQQVFTPGSARGTPTPTPTPPRGNTGGFGRPPQQVGPIAGVHSNSCDESIKIYDGRSKYCEWKFVLKQPTQGANARPTPPVNQGRP